MREEEIRGRFVSGKPSDEKAARHHEVARVMTAAALVINDLMEDGREKSLALTHLEDAAMWANKGIAHWQGDAAH